MSLPDQISETPKGFIVKECEGIDALFLMPATWFYHTKTKDGTTTFYMTQESIAERGRYETGLAVSAIPKMREKTGIEPVSFARRYITAQPNFEPTSEVVTFSEGGLIVFRRYFKTLPIQVASTVLYKEKNIYMECTGNNQTGMTYVALFEAPAEQWQQYAETGKIMIEGRILNSLV